MNLDLSQNTDEDFFGSLERSRTNLSKVFDETTENDTQQSLKYQPTKQPVAASDPAQPYNTKLAKVVTAYRQNKSMGKVGVALLQNAEKSIKLILYKAKTNILGSCTASVKGVVCTEVYRKNDYLQFYDDNELCWSLYFQQKTDEEEFVAALKSSNVQVYEEERGDADKDKSQEAINSPKSQNSEKLNAVVLASSKEAEKEENIAENVPASAEHSKTSLITRMAKVGQQLPPFSKDTPKTFSDFTDSSDTEMINAPTASRMEKPVIMPRNNKVQSKMQALHVSHSALNSVFASSNSVMESQLVQMLLAENRTQNTELRINMSKLEGKIEKIVDKIDVLQSQGGARSSSNRDDAILELEEKLLDLKKENRKLKYALEDKEDNAKSECNCLSQVLKTHGKELEDLGLANVKDLEHLAICFLERITSITACQQENFDKYSEQLTRNSQLETETKMAKIEKNAAIEKMQELEEKVKMLESDLENEAKIVENLKQELLSEGNRHEAQVQQQKLEIEKKEQEISDLGEQLLKQSKMYSDEKIKSPTRMHTDYVHQKEVEAAVKAIMNNLYTTLADKLEHAENFQKNSVIAVIGKTIREETLKSIRKAKDPK